VAATALIRVPWRKNGDAARARAEMVCVFSLKKILNFNLLNPLSFLKAISSAIQQKYLLCET
jgi:hypothetical protein